MIPGVMPFWLSPAMAETLGRLLTAISATKPLSPVEKLISFQTPIHERD
jgi:hypothetical protein